MSRPTVLVVEDEPDMLELLTLFLAVEHEVLPALDVATAWGLLRAHRCDLVITDIRMPGMSGVSLVQELRNTQPDVPIVVVSGFERDELLPVFRWLAKPFRRAELLATVREALAARASA